MHTTVNARSSKVNIIEKSTLLSASVDQIASKNESNGDEIKSLKGDIAQLNESFEE